ncbi:MAG: hypothetical protein LBI68_00590 [Azoarcus sp.]|jgi:hypothetical protein|nr:hypothetical protein [Azoarcus sp.]
MIPAILASLGYGLAISLIAFRCAAWLRSHPARMAAALAAACALLHLPVAGISLLTLLRGTLGDLSLVTIVILASAFLRARAQKQKNTSPPPLPLAYIRLFACAGLIFFLLSFGLLPIDIYIAGYASAALPCLVGALAFLLWLRGGRVLSLALLTALAGWRLHCLDSTNLWDYLLDVPLLVAALGCAVFSRRSPQGQASCLPCRRPDALSERNRSG